MLVTVTKNETKVRPVDGGINRCIAMVVAFVLYFAGRDAQGCGWLAEATPNKSQFAKFGTSGWWGQDRRHRDGGRQRRRRRRLTS